MSDNPNPAIECGLCDGSGHGISYIRQNDGTLIQPVCGVCKGTGLKAEPQAKRDNDLGYIHGWGQADA